MLAADLGDWLTWIGWVVVAVSAVILLTQFLSWSHLKVVGVLQSTNVPGTLILAVVAVAAVATGRPALALAAAIVAGVASYTVFRAVRPTVGPSGVPDSAPTVRIASSNLLYRNRDVVAAVDAIAAVDPDVAYLSEYTAAFHDSLRSHPLRLERPHRLEDPREKGSGCALWSRLPILDADPSRGDRDSVTALIDGPSGPVSILAVHPNTPVHDVSLWHDGLRSIRALAREIEHPLAVVGDFNATYWHPLYADLRRDGLLDEHVELGRGWSVSWPTHRPVPPWVRLDHVLTSNGLRAVRLADLDVPGSDHAGIVVDVTVAQRD